MSENNQKRPTASPAEPSEGSTEEPQANNENQQGQVSPETKAQNAGDNDVKSEAAPEGIEATGEQAAAKTEPSPEQQAAELKDKLLRAMAETENVRRRAERDKEDTAKYAVTRFARDILGVADNLRRALESAPKENSGDDVVKNLVLGVEMTEKELLSVMERHGVRPVEPLGEKFDHNFHQAMFEVPGTGQANGTVVQVMQTGYVINDRLLRPAMVGVAKDDKPTGDGGEDGGGEHVDTVA